MRAFALVTSLALAASLPLAATTVTQQDPTALAARIQQRYDTIRDFEADFVQTYQGGLLRTKTTESGHVAIKRPGRMRWTYSKPERKEFVADGRKVYSYLPQDKQVIVSPLPAVEQTTPALFLAGRGHLVRDFTVTAESLPGLPPGQTALRFVPRREDPEIEWMALAVDAATLRLTQLVALDRQGGRSTFVFSNLKENRNLSDTLFEFTIPRGVDVVETGGPRG